MKLVIGLGNPGRDYGGNRHNIGAMCLARFARENKISLDKRLGHARTGEGKIDGEKFVLARPQVFMNTSGRSVKMLSQRLGTPPQDIIVIHDDLDLPLGKIRIRQGGSSAGHKGIISIISELGSGDFIRVRIGIGRPDSGEDEKKAAENDVIDYVLGDFSPDEKKVMEGVIANVSEAIAYLVTNGLAAAMNKYN